jgi:hypothetical protein
MAGAEVATNSFRDKRVISNNVEKVKPSCVKLDTSLTYNTDTATKDDDNVYDQVDENEPYLTETRVSSLKSCFKKHEY